MNIKILKGNDFYMMVKPLRIKNGKETFDTNNWNVLHVNLNNIQIPFLIDTDKPLTIKCDLQPISNNVGKFNFEIILQHLTTKRKIRYAVKNLIEVIEFGNNDLNNYDSFEGDEKNFMTAEFKITKPNYLVE